VTHLRQAMLEELQRRNYATTTVDYYLKAVEYFHTSREFAAAALIDCEDWPPGRSCRRGFRGSHRCVRRGSSRPHGNRHSPPTGIKEISTLTGFTGLFISARRSERYVLDDVNDVMCAVLRISLVQEQSWVLASGIYELDTCPRRSRRLLSKSPPKRFARRTALHPGVQTLDTYQRQLCSRLRRAPGSDWAPTGSMSTCRIILSILLPSS
jgi:hypothetical protein